MTTSTIGYLQGMSLAIFLQLVRLERLTNALTIHAPNGSGSLFFVGGELFDARIGSQSGLVAAYRILSWEVTSIQIEELDAVPDRVIFSGLQELLFQAMKKKDELRQQVRQSQSEESEDQRTITDAFQSISAPGQATKEPSDMKPREPAGHVPTMPPPVTPANEAPASWQDSTDSYSILPQLRPPVVLLPPTPTHPSSTGWDLVVGRTQQGQTHPKLEPSEDPPTTDAKPELAPWDLVLRSVGKSTEWRETERRQRFTPASGTAEAVPDPRRSFGAADHFEQGFVLLKQKAYEEALVSWRKALELDPTNHSYQVNVKKLQRMLEEKQKR